MSKIMAASGNQGPVLKGTATDGDDNTDAGATGIFAALFGGMHLGETDGDAVAVQPVKFRDR